MILIHIFVNVTKSVKSSDDLCRCGYFSSKSSSVCVSEMCCGCGRPAGSDSASRCGREGRRGGVLDTAAENRLRGALSEEPQRPHATGAQQTGENIQVNVLSLEISGKTLSSTPLHAMVAALSAFKHPVCLHFQIAFPLLGSWCWLIHCYTVCFFYRHQQLTKLLSRYINEPIHHKPRESHGKYQLCSLL